MLTDDKATQAGPMDLDNNINTRDQRNVGIWLLVLVGLFVAFLISLGTSHAPNTAPAAESQQMANTSGNVPSNEGAESHNFSVNAPVGPVELPGTVGKPQKFLSGHGNTPVPPQQGSSPGVGPETAINAQSFQKAESGSTPSDAMPTGKDYKKGSEGSAPTGAPAAGSAPSTTGGAAAH